MLEEQTNTLIAAAGTYVYAAGTTLRGINYFNCVGPVMVHRETEGTAKSVKAGRGKRGVDKHDGVVLLNQGYGTSNQTTKRWVPSD